MVATTNQNKSCEAGDGGGRRRRRVSCEAGDGGSRRRVSCETGDGGRERGGVLGKECEYGGREITAAVETNYTDP